jgi:hypothetical protein
MDERSFLGRTQAQFTYTQMRSLSLDAADLGVEFRDDAAQRDQGRGARKAPLGDAGLLRQSMGPRW